MEKNRSFHGPSLLLLLCLLLGLSGCGVSQPSTDTLGEPPAETQSREPVFQTLETLCSADHQTYLTDTITMQMGNRIDKTPDVIYFPIRDGKPRPNGRGFSLSINLENLRDGKEDSYERNPGRVSFVFNHKFF